MVASLVKKFLTSNGNVRSAGTIGASQPNQGKIFAPGTNDSSRDDVQSTVWNDVGEADKLDANIEYLAQEDDNYKSPWKIKYAEGLKAVTYSSDSGEITLSALKEPMKGSHLGKRVRHSEGGSTDMDPIVT